MGGQHPVVPGYNLAGRARRPVSWHLRPQEGVAVQRILECCGTSYMRIWRRLGFQGIMDAILGLMELLV
jgi:hypothetical protein